MDRILAKRENGSCKLLTNPKEKSHRNTNMFIESLIISASKLAELALTYCTSNMFKQQEWASTHDH